MSESQGRAAFKLAQEAANAVTAMQFVTGCCAWDALQALLVLTADNEPQDRDQRIDALSYLIRTQPAPTQGGQQP